jgi:murein DD-endopeptidase MepM/ murein hydrolase activator NlpD
MIEKKLKLDNGIERCIPSISPTKGWIIRNFGYVRDEFTGRYKFCAGIDIASTKGTKVYATANGKVQFAGRKKNAGLMVVINHGHGFKTTYSHLSRLSVKRWKYIKRGTPIGYVGKTGKVEGPRLHYEVYVNEKPVNPLSFIPNGIESL